MVTDSSLSQLAGGVTKLIELEVKRHREEMEFEKERYRVFLEFKKEKAGKKLKA